MKSNSDQKYSDLSIVTPSEEISQGYIKYKPTLRFGPTLALMSFAPHEFYMQSQKKEEQHGAFRTVCTAEPRRMKRATAAALRRSEPS